MIRRPFHRKSAACQTFHWKSSNFKSNLCSRSRRGLLPLLTSPAAARIPSGRQRNNMFSNFGTKVSDCSRCLADLLPLQKTPPKGRIQKPHKIIKCWPSGARASDFETVRNSVNGVAVRNSANGTERLRYGIRLTVRSGCGMEWLRYGTVAIRQDV